MPAGAWAALTDLAIEPTYIECPTACAHLIEGCHRVSKGCRADRSKSNYAIPEQASYRLEARRSMPISLASIWSRTAVSCQNTPACGPCGGSPGRPISRLAPGCGILHRGSVVQRSGPLAHNRCNLGSNPSASTTARHIPESGCAGRSIGTSPSGQGLAGGLTPRKLPPAAVSAAWPRSAGGVSRNAVDADGG